MDKYEKCGLLMKAWTIQPWLDTQGWFPFCITALCSGTEMDVLGIQNLSSARDVPRES